MLEIANMIILIILIIVLLLSFLFINKTLKKKETILDEVKLQENTTKKDGFALMLQQDDGTYKEDTSGSWPSNMRFNAELSGCIDTNGKIIEESLSFDKVNNIVNVSVGETAYCYVYFDMTKYLSEYLINNVSSDVLWNSTLEDDGYRYVGTDPDNYICFGTTDKDTCTSYKDKYMYRIIGVFENNGKKYVKLIKKEALNTEYAWHSSDGLNVDWNESDLYKGLNGSYFLTNKSYSYMQDTNWTDKIATWNYTMTNTKTSENSGTEYAFMTTKNIYLHELNRSSKTLSVGEWKTTSGKISLMYVSDFLLSLGEPALSYEGTNWSELNKGWMSIVKNDSTSVGEWTMTRYGAYIDDNVFAGYHAIAISKVGYATRKLTITEFSARPSFYLDSIVEYDKGDGTIDNPYIIYTSSEEDKSTAAILINKLPSSELWPSSLEGDGYRFVGTNPNNYVCFGTTDKNTCLNDTGKYMYRIIGIFNDNNGTKHLKLIKKEGLNTKYVRDSESSADTDWNNSDLYKGIVGSYFLTNTDYSYMQDSNWLNKISTWNYTMTNTKSYENYTNNSVYGPDYHKNTAKVIYLHELNRASKSSEICYYNEYGTSPADADCNVGEWINLNTKVSLMYVSDYALSLGSKALNYVPWRDYDTLKTGWMHISNNDATFSKEDDFEWTMSRFGKYPEFSRAWRVSSGGGTHYNSVDYGGIVRPVFYLDNNVEFVDYTVEGSITDPYIIK